jgi:hypothetical protein
MPIISSGLLDPAQVLEVDADRRLGRADGTRQARGRVRERHLRRLGQIAAPPAIDEGRAQVVVQDRDVGRIEKLPVCWNKAIRTASLMAARPNSHSRLRRTVPESARHSARSSKPSKACARMRRKIAFDWAQKSSA